MEIRRYTKEDIPEMLRRLQEGLKDYHYREMKFDAVKVQTLLEGNVNNKMFFCDVIVEDHEVLGAMAATCVEFMFSHEAYALDHITYIRPEHRSLKAITTLVKNYIKWAKERRVRQIRWSQSSGYRVDKFGVLAKRLGFEQVGTHWNMEIGK